MTAIGPYVVVFWTLSRLVWFWFPRTKTIRHSTPKTTTGEKLIIGYTFPSNLCPESTVNPRLVKFESVFRWEYAVARGMVHVLRLN